MDSDMLSTRDVEPRADAIANNPKVDRTPKLAYALPYGTQGGHK